MSNKVSDLFKSSFLENIIKGLFLFKLLKEAVVWKHVLALTNKLNVVNKAIVLSIRKHLCNYCFFNCN